MLALTYVMTQRGSMPFEHYRATLQIMGDDYQCEVVFTARYEPIGVSEEQAQRMLSKIYQALIKVARTDLLSS
ncbi:MULTISPECIES: hypothetical protein [Pseudomonas]|uniref:hypothetical protein n=1 Tax=Pseudomonas TaxID=286 RepID=UPI00300B0231